MNTQLMGPAGLAVEPLDLHVVNTGSIPVAPTHGEVSQHGKVHLLTPPGDMLESGPKARRILDQA